MHLFTQQTKELVRRKTEILVHGSEVDKVNNTESDDHFKQLTLRRMQTRGKTQFLTEKLEVFKIQSFGLKSFRQK